MPLRPTPRTKIGGSIPVPEDRPAAGGLLVAVSQRVSEAAEGDHGGPPPVRGIDGEAVLPQQDLPIVGRDAGEEARAGPEEKLLAPGHFSPAFPMHHARQTLATLRTVDNREVRRGTGHALLGLQEFIQPSVEYLFEAQNTEPKEEDDLDADEGDPAALRQDLAASLGRSSIDLEGVRRLLTAAQRAGLDWRTFYDEAMRAEVTERLYRAPSMPPSWRVAPRQ